MTALPITEAGVYDLPEDVYHADPVAGGSLSSTVARLMMPPSTPALARWRMDNPEHKDAYDLGTVWHKLTLGVGAPIVEVVAENWQTKAARELQATARAEGKVPLLSKDLARVRRMVDAVHAHPMGGALLACGAKERTYVWRDPASGVWCRSMVDSAPDQGVPYMVDLKSSTATSPTEFAKKAGEYGYHQQQEHYLDGHEALYGERPVFLFLVVPKGPPHWPFVAQLDDEAAAAGRARNAYARDLWADCHASGDWPGHDPNTAHLVSLPRWALTTP